MTQMQVNIPYMVHMGIIVIYHKYVLCVNDI